MNRLRSFRSHLIVGALLFTAGLLPIAHMLSMLVIRKPRVFTLHMRHETMVLWLAAVLLMLAGLSLVRRGFRPFNLLRTRLSELRKGQERRIEGRYPAEVEPLVADLNALLEDRERMVTRALSKTADLAHGLKTPLAVLAQEGERAEAAGQSDLAASIRDQVERMRRQIDYHLAHARAETSGATPGAQCSVLVSANGLARTLLQLHAGRGLTINVEVLAEHSVRARREDLDEMLGNLLDNACKWAKSRVTVRSAASDSGIVIMVEDDGPGLDPSLRESVLQRGVRADEASPGTGLGLAIVSDLAELYGGSISLNSSPQGGLQARLQLPSAN
ncbi:MAG TPA: ATP-binding protein [Bryobacteraceae bacterium]|nr:ATP-binding protein [Bryobacteraceae bacterium]